MLSINKPSGRQRKTLQSIYSPNEHVSALFNLLDHLIGEFIAWDNYGLAGLAMAGSGGARAAWVLSVEGRVAVPTLAQRRTEATQLRQPFRIGPIEFRNSVTYRVCWLPGH